MRVVLISDTHTRHKYLTSKGMGNILKEGDLLIHAGDFSSVGQKGEVQNFIKWLDQQSKNYTYGAIFIAGNHDRSFDPKYFREYEDNDLWGDFSHLKKPEWVCNILSDLKSSSSSVTYLENQDVTVNKLKIWGSPVTPWFFGEKWAFNKQRGAEIKEVWNKIPVDTDIIITHCPVIGRLDYVPSTKEYAGCEELRNKIEEIKPVLHVCGHIHEGYGESIVNGTVYVNASICDRFYDPINKPIVIDIDIKNKNVIY